MQRAINVGLVLGSLCGYLEWGGGNSAFLAQAELDFLLGRAGSVDALLHPFVVLPLAGQALVLVTVFQRTPSRRLTTVGILLMGVLLGLIAFIGIMSLNYRIALSTAPFLACAVWHFRTKPAGG